MPKESQDAAIMANAQTNWKVDNAASNARIVDKARFVLSVWITDWCVATYAQKDILAIANARARNNVDVKAQNLLSRVTLKCVLIVTVTFAPSVLKAYMFLP